jgi:hypothetical protein
MRNGDVRTEFVPCQRSGRLFWLGALVACMAMPMNGCSSAAEGCTKDTDCASGRICGTDARCVPTTAQADAGTRTMSSSTPSGKSSTSPEKDCQGYIVGVQLCGDPCVCGTHQNFFDFSAGRECRCQFSCATDQDCANAGLAAGATNLRGLCVPAGKYFPSWCRFDVETLGIPF